MLKKPSRNKGAGKGHTLSDEKIYDLVITLTAQIHDVSLRLAALRAVFERRGIPATEFDQAYEYLRAQGPAQIEEGLRRAVDEMRQSMLEQHKGTKH